MAIKVGVQAFTQDYLSRQISDTLAVALPLLYMLLAMDGNKKGWMGIGVPNSGALISRIPAARAREKQIYGSYRYRPLVHSVGNDDNDTKALQMLDNMPVVGGAGGSGFVGVVNLTGSTPNFTVATVSVVRGGSGYSPNVLIEFVGGALSTSYATGHATVVGGVITAVTVDTSSADWTIAPQVAAYSLGTTHEQHFARPEFGFCEFATPIKVGKKYLRKQKNLLAGASKGEKEMVLGSLIKSAADEARVTHLTRWAREFIGITTTADAGPSSQDAEVWDHILSIPAACHASNLYGNVDRSNALYAYWRGNRTTTHVAANIADLVNYGNYKLGCSDIGLPLKVGFCGPTLFPIFKSQALAQGGKIIYNGVMPEMGMFGMKHEIIQFGEFYLCYDPQIPDKARTDPRTGSAYTKNAVLMCNLDTYTFAFEPDAKFTVDEPFDLTQTDGGQDAWKNQIRTELMAACEAPKGNAYWEDVG